MSEEYIKYALFTVNKQALYEKHEQDLHLAFKQARRMMYSKYWSSHCMKTVNLTQDANLPIGYYRAPADLITWFTPQPIDTIEQDGEKLYKLSNAQITYIYDTEIITDLYAPAICTLFLIDIAILLGLVSGELPMLQSKLVQQEIELNNSIKRSSRQASTFMLNNGIY